MKRQINAEGKIKLVLTTSLLMYSIVVAFVTKNCWIFVAMLFSTIGDIMIASSRGAIELKLVEKKFDTGVIAFGIAHLTYVLAMKTTVSKILSHSMAIILIALILCYYLLKEKRPFLAAYGVLLFQAVVNATNYSTQATIGAILFLVSDVVLVLFEKKSPKWQYVIWGLYVPAQVLLLTSVLIH